MIIIGAKGFAKEVLQLVYDNNSDQDIFFFDNINKATENKLYNKFTIIKSIDEVKHLFNSVKQSAFVLGIGSPLARKKMFTLFLELGGVPKTVIAKTVSIGGFDVLIGEGSTLMQGSIITNSISIGKGCLINLNCTIGHDSVLGDFVELSPNVNISGRCNIGELTSIGTNATILPDINIGKNCVIGAGTVVLKDVPDNSVVVGVPGKIIKTIN